MAMATLSTMSTYQPLQVNSTTSIENFECLTISTNKISIEHYRYLCPQVKSIGSHDCLARFTGKRRINDSEISNKPYT